MRSVFTGLALVLLASPSQAFVFFEHAWFSDTGCGRAQRVLADHVAGLDRDDPERSGITARYLALALVCPERATPRYCGGDEKFAQSQLNRLDGDLGDYPVTFGDFSGLADHYTQFGPVRGLPRAGDDGLIAELWSWMAVDPGDPGGVVGDIAEEACDHDVDVPWDQVNADAIGAIDALPATALASRRRRRPSAGPRDPDALFSFENPHFLDLQLRNHIHFGEAAHQTWLGLHGAAIDVGQARCADVLGLDADALDDLDPGHQIDWDALAPQARRAAGCALLAGFVRARLLRWATRTEPARLRPVADWILRLVNSPGDPEVVAQLDRVVAATHGVVLEAVGLHFLEDGLAGGHVRTDRAARGLADSRHTHDLDGDEGVPVVIRTRGAPRALVAFGDGRLFGPELAQPKDCAIALGTSRDPDEVTACLLRRQRTVVTTAVTASVLDWALGGTLYATRPCGDPGTAERAICDALPVAPPGSTPAATTDADAVLSVGALPVPPPPFGYEALLMVNGLDVSGGAPQLGARLVLLTELGSWANWMRSHQIALTNTLGGGRDARLDLEYGHAFHFRWGARFLVDAGPFVFIGASHLDEDAALTYGVGPAAAFTLLPEGWTQIPLQISLGYRLPFQLGNTRGNDPRIVGHLFEIALGLAFL